MDGYVWRIIFILIALSFLAIMWLATLMKKPAMAAEKGETMLPSETRRDPAIQQQEQIKPVTHKQQDDLLILSVIAKQNDHFASYDLLQAISSVGMQFGAMNIFHYYQQTPEKKYTLFSLASATSPGDFDLDKIGDFSCSGLFLFLRLNSVPNPSYAFKLMLAAAEQLADDLDGELRADPHTPWSQDILDRYQEKISQVQLTETV